MNWNDQCRRWASKYAKDKLMERSKGLCERCKKKLTVKDPGVIHHIKYRKAMTSLLFVCNKCHKNIHDRQDQKAFLNKLIFWVENFPNDYTVKDVIETANKELEELGKDRKK